MVGLDRIGCDCERGEKTKMNNIHCGQVYWDKDNVWTHGAIDLKCIHIVLSYDYNKNLGKDAYQTCSYVWIDSSNHYGIPRLHELTEEELLKMYLVGDIKQVKAFGEEKQEWIVT